MKKILLIGIGLLMAAYVSAQERKSPKAENVFAEFGGPGLFTFNYDTRFKGNSRGLGARVGIGYIGTDGYHLVSIPVGLNFLMGNEEEGKYFEVGLNGTYTSSSDNWYEDEEDPDGSHVLGSLVFGYRKQPGEGGFTFRTGLSPYFGKDYFFPFVPYVSFGYAF
ncbi:hypothetical protein [Echinicola rosea]|uniref:Outer membrane protein beta-barrel domain-containing protein n=1 Tax=Echinicola rosea TaxID=1807691 RepID=A0ABQ1V3S6_9BACT|nr:hypothetical protein [Echinicola rosea]GGF37513.1 hypothetical protein GCM10011339_27580 [Echinicola rosea]